MFGAVDAGNGRQVRQENARLGHCQGGLWLQRLRWPIPYRLV